jgi:Protein of unknown function (DUF2934)
MDKKGSETRPRRKAPGGRVEFVLTGALPSEGKAIEVRQPVDRPAEPLADTEERARWIAEAAYFRAEQRGFSPGFEFEDWTAAEGDYELELRKRAGDTAGKSN